MTPNLTPARRALLADIADPDVRVFGSYDPDKGATQHRLRRAYGRTENVTAEITKLVQAGYARKGLKESASTYAKFPVELTDAGRAELPDHQPDEQRK